MKSTKEFIPSVCLSDLKKLTERVGSVSDETDPVITFEFIIASLFPTSWKNMQNELSRQYTLGYMQGHKDAESERRAAIIANCESDCYCE